MKKRPIVIVCFLTVLIILFLSFTNDGLLYGTELSGEAADCLKNSSAPSLGGRVSDMRKSESGYVLALSEVTLAHKEEDGTVAHLSFPGVLIFVSEDPGISTGAVIDVCGSLQEMKGAENPGQFDSAAYYRKKGIRYTMNEPSVKVVSDSAGIVDFFEKIRSSLRTRIEAVFPEDSEGIFSALLIGDRTILDDDTRSLWQRSGISHMLAISGMHLSLIGMALYELMRKMRMPRTAGTLVLMGILSLYTLMTGCSLSTVRALIMFAYYMGAKVTGRSHDPANAVALSMLLILSGSPGSLFDTGFLMSYSAVITCYVFRRKSKVYTAIALYMTSLPLILKSYFEMPVFSIFLNLFLVPFLPALLLTGFIGTVFGGAAAWPGILILRFFSFVMTSLESRFSLGVIIGEPALISILLYYIFLGILFREIERRQHYKRRILVMALFPLLFLFFVHFPDGAMELTALSVGQGDALVLRGAAGTVILVDGGSSSVTDVGANRILPYLKSEGIGHLTYIAVTHSDTDHMNGILEIMKKMASHETSLSVGGLILPIRDHSNDGFAELTAYAELLDIPVREVSAGECLRLSDMTLNVLNPDEDLKSAEENEASLVLSVSFGNFDALLTGDVTGEGEEKTLDWIRGSGVDYEVLKVAHHGSKYSTSDEFLQAVRAETALISVGNYSLYGHPHKELLERLENAGMDILRTGQSGAVTVETDGKSYRVITYLSPEE